MLNKILKIIGYSLGSLIFFVLALSLVFYVNALPVKNPDWGVNFATGQSRYLGYEPPVLMDKILTDLNPAVIRLTGYWEELEPTRGEFTFDELDELLDLTDASSTKVVLVLGHKQPRWPECHHPDWWETLSPAEQESTLHNFIGEVVTRYKDRPSIWAWQLENEPFFDFGEDCPVTDIDSYKASVEVVRSLDTRPIIITDSGEKGSWIIPAWAGADLFGSTMYREVFHGEKGKYITYPLPAFTYTVKAGGIKAFSPIQEVLGMELQAEPWFNGDPYEVPLDEQFTLMNPEIFAKNIAYAKRAGFSQHYFWGVEWWYWLDAQGEPAMLNAAKQFFKKN